MKRVEDPSKLQLIALSLSPNIGAATLSNLLRHFDHDLDAALSASADELTRVRGIGEKIASEIGAINLDRLAGEMESWRAEGISILMRGDADYPAPLSTAEDAPLALFASRAGAAGYLVERGRDCGHSPPIEGSVLHQLGLGDAVGARGHHRRQRAGARH